MKKKNSLMSLIYNGVVKSNPSLVLMLGMCPTLAVTTSASNGFGMGVSTMAVLIVSNLLISLLRKLIPDAVRLPAYIVVVASLVTVVEMIMQAYVPSLYNALGLYIPLIVVNCIILGRAEAFASQNDPIPSVFDGIGMGLGFTLALTLIGSVRELLGAGSLFGISIMPESYQPMAIFIKAPGAFLVIAMIIAVMNALKIPTRANEVVEDCDGCCAHCNHCTAKEKEGAK